MTTPRIVACPQCGKPVEWSPASRWRPFCSERCKMLDFGAWASDAYRIPASGDDAIDVADDTSLDPPPPGDPRRR
jgi:endogenous inhibitor of DNA gyrase (YacG/DUF329 family)